MGNPRGHEILRDPNAGCPEVKTSLYLGLRCPEASWLKKKKKIMVSRELTFSIQTLPLTQ